MAPSQRQAVQESRPRSTADASAQSELDFASRVLDAEAAAIRLVADRLDGAFNRAVDAMEKSINAGGAVVVTGLGKSLLIGRKISATLASLGAPSHDVHPSDAVHGDLGRIRPNDCLLALSYSGETEEVVALASILRQDRVPVISITGGDAAHESGLARASDIHLSVGAIDEACDVTFAPTCSTTAMLALGDALALALSRRLAHGPEDFRKRHPGGGLGGLLRPVSDLLRFTVGQNLPVAPREATVGEALSLASQLGRRPGAIIIAHDDGRMAGLFTDGDLRRLVLSCASDGRNAMSIPIAQVMTDSPRTLPADALIRDAVRLFREHRQDEIPVVDAQGRPIGVLDVQDLIAMRVVRP